MKELINSSFFLWAMFFQNVDVHGSPPSSILIIICPIMSIDKVTACRKTSYMIAIIVFCVSFGAPQGRCIAAKPVIIFNYIFYHVMRHWFDPITPWSFVQ